MISRNMNGEEEMKEDIFLKCACKASRFTPPNGSYITTSPSTEQHPLPLTKHDTLPDLRRARNRYGASTWDYYDYFFTSIGGLFGNSEFVSNARRRKSSEQKLLTVLVVTVSTLS